MEVCQGSNPRNNSTNKAHPTVYIVIQKYNVNYKSYLLKFTNTDVFKKRILEVIKKQRDATNFTLYRILLLRVISVISTFNISPESRQTTFFEKRPNAPFSFQLLKHRFKCTIKLPWFQHFLNSSNFQNTVTNSAKMYRLASLLSTFSKQFQLPKHRFKKRQNATFSFVGFKMF